MFIYSSYLFEEKVNIKYDYLGIHNVVSKYSDRIFILYNAYSDTIVHIIEKQYKI